MWLAPWNGLGAEVRVCLEPRQAKTAAALVGGLAAILLMATPLEAAPGGDTGIQGAWAEQSSGCQGIFASRSGKAVFSPKVSLFAPAFIITGKRLVTPQASCRRKSAKADGARTIVTLSCANSVSHADVEVILQKMSDGRLSRYYDDKDATGSSYVACKIDR